MITAMRYGEWGYWVAERGKMGGGHKKSTKPVFFGYLSMLIIQICSLISETPL